jgi:hypothetical protein
LTEGIERKTCPLNKLYLVCSHPIAASGHRELRVRQKAYRNLNREQYLATDSH